MDYGGPTRIGRGASRGHHGEILQGVFRSGDALVHGLITVPCSEFGSTATYYPSAGSTLAVRPSWKKKAARAAQSALNSLGGRSFGGCLDVNTRGSAGAGCGTSTSDIVAAVRAVADAHRVTFTPWQVARWAVAAETASDPTMLDEANLLFGQLTARAIERFSPATLEMVIVSGYDQARPPVLTTEFPRPCYHRDQVATLAQLLAAARQAFAEDNLGLLADVATKSAVLNQKFLPKTAFGDVVDGCLAAGAVGVQVAHSGNLVGAIVDPASRHLDRTLHHVGRVLSGAGYAQIRHFRTAYNRSRESVEP